MSWDQFGVVSCEGGDNLSNVGFMGCALVLFVCAITAAGASIKARSAALRPKV